MLVSASIWKNNVYGEFFKYMQIKNISVFLLCNFLFIVGNGARNKESKTILYKDLAQTANRVWEGHRIKYIIKQERE